MKFKDNVLVSYSNGICRINKGTTVYEIEDSEKKMYEYCIDGNWKADINDERFSFLVEENLITKKYKNLFKGTMYEKNIYFYESLDFDKNEDLNLVQERIMKKKVAVLGCGGIGTVVIQNLIGYGVQNFILIDFDTVDISNLNRQLFFNYEDIGIFKVDVLKRKINSINKDISVQTYIQKIDCLEDLHLLLERNNIDLFVNCADKPNNISQIVNSVCENEKIPYIEGGVGIDSGTWGPLQWGQKFKNTEIHNQYSINGSICSTNMIVAAYMSYDILNFFLNICKNTNNQKSINFFDYSIDLEN